MDPLGGNFFGTGRDQQNPNTLQSNNPPSPSPFSFVNPLASMMSMMQGSPNPSDDNKAQPKAPAKITMNIPSFLPKIQATTSSSSVPKKPQEENTKSQQPSGHFTPFFSPNPTVPIPKSSPVRNPNPPNVNIPRPTLLHGQSSPHLMSPAPRQPRANSMSAVRQQRYVPPVSLTSTSPKVTPRAPPPGQRNMTTAIRGPTPTSTPTIRTSVVLSQLKVTPTAPTTPTITRDQHQQPRKNPLEDPLSFCGDPLATEDTEMEDSNPQKCDVPSCSHVKSPSISLFSIPPHGLASWCQILKIDLSRISSAEIASLKICSEHFDLTQFVDGSACKDLKPTAVPRPSAFSINALTTTTQAKRKEPPIAVLNFVPVPVPIVEKPQVPSLHPDVTIQRIPAPLNPQGVQQAQVQQQRPVQPNQPSSALVRPRAPVPAAAPSPQTQTASPRTYPPPSKVQIMTVPAPTASITATYPPPGESTSPSTCLASIASTLISQQVGMRKPGPSRGPRGRPRKNAVSVNIPTTPVSSAPRPPLTTTPVSSLLSTSKTPNVSQVPPQQLKVAVGSYCRPTVNAKSENVKIDDLAFLVMPSEDWSVNVYPSFNKDSKNQICTISETILNSDMVEIVKKSITVHSSWAMKFSILSKDMSHFNLGLGVTDRSDLQAVLDKFFSLPCCKGLSDTLNNKNYNVLSLQMKVLVERFVDNVFRSVNCPLLIVSSEPANTDSTQPSLCKPCRSLLQSLSFLKSQ